MENEPVYGDRIRKELEWLKERSNFEAVLIKEGGNYFVLYPGVTTAGKINGLPETVDVLVPVPPGYPTSAIDMPALPSDSKLIAHVFGGSNPQGTIAASGRQWRILSYHPYNGGGAAAWNPMLHGFHDYYHQIFIWLHNLL